MPPASTQVKQSFGAFIAHKHHRIFVCQKTAITSIQLQDPGPDVVIKVSVVGNRRCFSYRDHFAQDAAKGPGDGLVRSLLSDFERAVMFYFALLLTREATRTRLRRTPKQRRQ